MPFIFFIDMAGTLGKVAKYGKEIFTKLDSGYNFLEQKDFVTHYIDREKQEKDNVVINGSTTRWYIGKVFSDPSKRSNSYYSDDFIIGSLKYLFEKTLADGTVVIQIGPEISELMNGEEDVQNTMAQEAEKQHIQKIFNEHVNSKKIKKEKKKLKIVSFDQTNPSLFSALREGNSVGNTLQNLKSQTKPPLDSDAMTSLDIAKYLYRVAQHDNIFFRLLESTKVHGVKKTDSNSPEYYGLIEIACRLRDFLQHGIYVQGGGLRQQKYDNIIKTILHGDTNYPELSELTTVCQNILSSQSEESQKFQGIYFDGKKNREIIEKQIQAREVQMKAKAITYGVSAALFAVFSYYIVSKTIEKNRIEKQIQLVLDNYIKDKSISVRFDNRPPMSVGNDVIYKREHLKYLSESIAERFCSQYHIGDLTKQDITLMALQLLITDEFRDVIDGEDIRYGGENKDYFIRNILIPNYSIQFVKSGVRLESYERYRDHEDAFINTLNYDISSGPLQIDRKTISIPAAGEIDITDIKKIGTYYHGSIYDLGTYKKDGKKYLLAFPETGLVGGAYDIGTGQNIAFDYFLQKNPIIEDIFNSFLLTYSGDKSYLGHNNRTKNYNDSIFIDSPERDDMNQEVKRLIIKHFINTHSYKNDKRKQMGTNKYTGINQYLESFFKDNQMRLEQLGFNSIPYQRLEKHKDAFQNSINYYDKENKDQKLLVLTYKDMVDLGEIDYIGDFMSINGDIVGLKLVMYKGKRYVVGREIYKPRTESLGMKYSYDDSYAILYGKNVGVEFLNKIKEAKVKKILENKSKDKTNVNELKKEQRKRIYTNPSTR